MAAEVTSGPERRVNCLCYSFQISDSRILKSKIAESLGLRSDGSIRMDRQVSWWGRGGDREVYRLDSAWEEERGEYSPFGRS